MLYFVNWLHSLFLKVGEFVKISVAKTSSVCFSIGSVS